MPTNVTTKSHKSVGFSQPDHCRHAILPNVKCFPMLVETYFKKNKILNMFLVATYGCRTNKMSRSDVLTEPLWSFSTCDVVVAVLEIGVVTCEWTLKITRLFLILL